jgi:hypothetical protein
MTCESPKKDWASVTYGGPAPRVIRPLVRINGMVEDMPVGYKFDRCLMPDTILKIDPCAQTLQVNDAMVSYADMFPCMKLPVGTGAPLAAPQAGYYPFYLDLSTKDFYVFNSGTWVKVT